MAAFLNWFAFERVPDGVDVAVHPCSAWDQARTVKKEIEAQGSLAYNMRLNDAPAVVVYAGTQPADPPWKPVTLSVSHATSTPLVNTILERSLATHLANRGFDIHISRYGVTAHPRVAKSDSILDLRPGVHLSAFRSGPNSPYGAAIRWDVRVRFTAPLADARLRAIGVGAPVVELKRSGAAPSSGERQRFIGILLKTAGSNGVVRTRTGETATIDLREYTLEATQRVLQQYASKGGGSPRRLWQDIQRLSLSLDENGARNKRVLLDRLDAITRMLSENGSTTVMFDFLGLMPRRVLLRLEPYELRGDDVHN